MTMMAHRILLLNLQAVLRHPKRDHQYLALESVLMVKECKKLGHETCKPEEGAGFASGGVLEVADGEEIDAA